MRTFKKGDTVWETSDEITIKALINSGFEEVIEIEQEIVKPVRKRSKIEE